MFKVMSLMKRRSDLSFADFRNWAEAKHPLLAQKLPGLRGKAPGQALWKVFQYQAGTGSAGSHHRVRLGGEVHGKPERKV